SKSGSRVLRKTGMAISCVQRWGGVGRLVAAGLPGLKRLGAVSGPSGAWASCKGTADPCCPVSTNLTKREQPIATE
ncbi:MAG: hypothetical protein P3W94_007445, partial [Paracoccus sp. (in: a-proteobacteria)]|nr:hypothetical protein [Paracoccus sp. (in: a-proteobacteria)]